MKKNIFLYILISVISLLGCVWLVYIKVWTFAIIIALGFVTALIYSVVLIKKIKHEKEMDAKHSDEFKRVSLAGKSGYEYAYTEYTKDSFEKIYDWERNELEDIIWNNYLSGRLLPYLEKYDGKRRLQEDLVSPRTPEGWKKEISSALDMASEDDNSV